MATIFATIPTSGCKSSAPRPTRFSSTVYDPYGGSDLSNLRPFFSQCNLVFRNCLGGYHSDQLKTMYAVSWLEGTGVGTSLMYPSMAKSFLITPSSGAAFEEALKSTFGEPDPVASAIHKLDNLSIKDHHHLTSTTLSSMNTLPILVSSNEP